MFEYDLNLHQYIYTRQSDSLKKQYDFYRELDAAAADAAAADATTPASSDLSGCRSKYLRAFGIFLITALMSSVICEVYT